ncbi:hypothetical protein FKM82_021615 [Ascaphus truei]
MSLLILYCIVCLREVRASLGFKVCIPVGSLYIFSHAELFCSRRELVNCFIVRDGLSIV